ncbi:hypothetical protein [Amedibacillus sp. YH-ame10]
MKNMKKRVEKILLSSTMVLTMAFTVMPINVFATENDTNNKNSASPRSGEVEINETNFPDSIFRQYISEDVNANIDSNKDGFLSQEERNKVTTMNLSYKEITDLKGIEYFSALTDLYCNNNKLTSLDLRQNTALEVIMCDENQLTSLDVSKNSNLEKLACSFNNITSLDVSENTALRELDCSANPLGNLDVTNNTDLEVLVCMFNQLTSLDVTNNINLNELLCCNIPIEAMPEENEYLKLYFNQFTSIDVSKNIKLEYLACFNTQLTSLDVSQNTALAELYCNGNQLTSLDLSNNTFLELLDCSAQTRTFTYDKNKGYLLSAYDAGFNKSNASDFEGATLEGDGTLTGVTLDTPITYNYDTGFNAFIPQSNSSMIRNSGLLMDVTLTFTDRKDSSKLEEAKPLAEKAIKEFGVTNSTTNKNILDAVATGISSVDDVTATWKTGSPIITKATKDKEGSITGTIILTSGSKSIEIAVNKVIDKLPSKTTIVDKTTGIEIGYEDGSPFAEDITLVVTPKSKEEMKEFQNNVNKVVTGKTIAGVYDIKLLKNGVEIQPNGKLKISLSLTEEMKAMSELQVVYIDDNGMVTIIPSQLIDGKLVFITDHFSYYGVIGKENSTGQIQPETPSKPTSPQTGDTSNTMLCLGLIVLSGSIVGYGVKKKKALSK